jgi:hypothetical protein
MGKGDKHVQKQQELRQRASILKPWENRPITRSWLGDVYSSKDIEGQFKLAETLISKKKHR